MRLTDVYAAEDDPYCFDGTTVLRNKFGIRDADTLSALETELAMARADEPLPDGRMDVGHFLSVHYHLFQDVYDWAGQPRTVRTSKGTSNFCYPEHIEAQLEILFRQLRKDGLLVGFSKSDFARKAAEFLATLNVIHAFREGNGRAQLSFMILLAQEAGHPFDMQRLEPQGFLQAMIASFHGNEDPLARLLEDIAS